MPAGRPPLYETPEEMQRIIDLYYLAVSQSESVAEEIEILSEEDKATIKSIEDVVPSVSGLAYILDMSTESFRRYGTEGYNKDSEFCATVKRAKQRVEMSLEQRLAGNAVTGSIFSLKNNFGWKDKTETDITSGGERIKNDWHIHPVTTSKNGED